MDIVTYALLKKQLETKANLVDGKVPADELPSYVDDVVEYDSFDEFPAEGESGKIYVALDTGKTYRWSGSAYIQIGGGEFMVKTTWAELKAARDAGELQPGMQYRITDYQCTVSLTNVSSANHQFDVIVTADSANTLNEIARAALHEGDTYFANSKLSAWILWYCLDNDTNRFDWAKSSGKGVIYRMIDEWNNDVPYDFKNILYSTSPQSSDYYTNRYTFCHVLNGSKQDVSLKGWNFGCVSNFIAPWLDINNHKQRLNRTMFYSSTFTFECYNNYIGPGNHDNVIGNMSFNNTIAPNFTNNSIGNNFYQNTISSGFVSNRINQTFTRNSIDSWFYGNYIGSNFEYNKIDYGFQNNTIGIYFCRNRIGNNFSYNKIGNNQSTAIYVSYCIFDSNIQYISLTSEDTASQSNLIQYVHIHSGVKGTSSSDLKTISVSRGLNYDTDYYPINSVRREI